MAQKIRFKHRLEYATLKVFAFLAKILPHRFMLAIAFALALVLFHLVRFRRAETIRRINLVLNNPPPRTAQWIAWVSLRNLCFNIVEMMKFPSLSEKQLRKLIVNYDEVFEALGDEARKYGGLVMAVPHCGNWDLGGIGFARRSGVKLFSVAGVQKNPLTNDWLNRSRGEGMTILERGSVALRQTLTRLKAGETFVILSDVRMKTKDIEVPFFGGTLNAGRGMASFAITAEKPVQIMATHRIGWTRHIIIKGSLFNLDKYQAMQKSAAIEALTQDVMAEIESIILGAPEQWFWYNKRWLLDKVEN